MAEHPAHRPDHGRWSDGDCHQTRRSVSFGK